MRRFFAPSNPEVALRVVAALFGLLGAFFVLWSLLKLSDLDLAPVRLMVFGFGIAHGLTSVLLLRASEWGRRLGFLLLGIWALIAGLALVVDVGFSLFWNHSVPAEPVIAVVSLTLVYVWMSIVLLRSDVWCILN